MKLNNRVGAKLKYHIRKKLIDLYTVFIYILNNTNTERDIVIIL